MVYARCTKAVMGKREMNCVFHRNYHRAVLIKLCAAVVLLYQQICLLPKSTEAFLKDNLKH